MSLMIVYAVFVMPQKPMPDLRHVPTGLVMDA